MNYIELLIFLAVLPVVLLCIYVYKKDKHKEPLSLLMKLFAFGILVSIPVVIVEMIVEGMFKNIGINNFYILFFHTFLTVGLIEEGYKWLIVKKFGYNNNEFDEYYDVLVYSVFVSLGFAFIENILYVLTSDTGIATAIMRAIFSVPGHTCFAIVMGYYMAEAKSNFKNINKANNLLLLSIIIPTSIHTLFDSFLFATEQFHSLFFGLFIVFYFVMILYCIILVNNASQLDKSVSDKLPISENSNLKINYCSNCGNKIDFGSYCSNCGKKIE